jgi:hypothetical protein
MSQVIVFENENGGVAVCYPSQEALQIMSIYQIAKKDVPEGKDFWIIDSSILPSDNLFFNAWELDKEALGKPHGTGSQKII